MPLRLIEMVLREKDSAAIGDLLKEQQVVDHREIRFPDGEVLLRILLQGDKSEAVLDLLEKRYASQEGYRVVVLPVEATSPHIEPVTDAAAAPVPEQQSPDRVSRQELYEDISDAARLSRVYVAMIVLSTIVAAIGLYYDSVAIIIGAMVMAPLLGPNMALALGTTLGDLALLRRALLTAVSGIAITMVLSVALGVLLRANPASPELASRDAVAVGDIVVALASGAAGAVAFTTGVSAVLIGVMVAVALLPPLVTFGLLLGGGHPAPALGALSLFLTNLIGINLAAVTTFLVQGIRPATWWEKDRAAKATRIAIGLWATLLAAMVGVILLSRKG